MSHVRALIVIALSIAASPAFAQTTPGQINYPSTYRGSMANQAAEQARSAEIQAQSAATVQQLDQSYAAIAGSWGAAET